MDLKNYFYTIFRSLNPESYVELTDHDLGRAIKYFFFLTTLVCIISFLLFIPALWGVSPSLHDKAQNFENLDVNFSIKLSEPFILLDDPLIRVSDSVNLTDEKFLITEEGIEYKQFFFFGKPKLFEWNKDNNLKESLFDNGFSGLMIFFAPSFAIWGVLVALIYYVIIILFTFLISLIIVWVIGLRMSWEKMLKAAIYSATVMILVQLLVLPFYRLIIVPLILYWLLYTIVLLLIKDETKGHGSQVILDKKSRKNNIFKDNDSEDSDSVNIKRSRRKRSYSEENDGYVELK